MLGELFVREGQLPQRGQYGHPARGDRDTGDLGGDQLPRAGQGALGADGAVEGGDQMETARDTLRDRVELPDVVEPLQPGPQMGLGGVRGAEEDDRRRTRAGVQRLVRRPVPDHPGAARPVVQRVLPVLIGEPGTHLVGGGMVRQDDELHGVPNCLGGRRADAGYRGRSPVAGRGHR
ncbi:hypothetical protein, partial [Streptomyces sp. NPDC058953]|uniref:hypothetical protein n=1 Tax=Streptomyces sp. NPDC058953 TaxID=3346676 RepID=UPI0036A9CE2D